MLDAETYGVRLHTYVAQWRHDGRRWVSRDSRRAMPDRICSTARGAPKPVRCMGDEALPYLLGVAQATRRVIRRANSGRPARQRFGGRAPRCVVIGEPFRCPALARERSIAGSWHSSVMEAI